MKKLSPAQIDKLRSYLCMHGAGFKNCSDCPFFSQTKKCNKRRKVFSKDIVQEIANACEVIKQEDKWTKKY